VPASQPSATPARAAKVGAAKPAARKAQPKRVTKRGRHRAKTVRHRAHRGAKARAARVIVRHVD
jgi:hypothetical protein